MASGKRLPNLGEILSPTVQPPNPRNTGGPPANGQDGPDHPANIGGRSRDRARRRMVEGEDGNTHTEPPASGQNMTSLPASIQQNGTFHCDHHLRSKKCDVCDHMTERRKVFSSHFERSQATIFTLNPQKNPNSNGLYIYKNGILLA